jgi:hypothetical protein
VFNPFAILTPPLLEAFVQSGKRFFVRQQFNRAHDHFHEEVKGYFIITHYAEKGHAEHHYGAISEDAFKFLYDWQDPDHQKKLCIASSQPKGYRIYSSVFNPDWQKHITNRLKQKLRNYVEGKSGWKPTVAETVGFDIYVNYGGLYARLKLRTQEVRVKLEEIENYS